MELVAGTSKAGQCHQPWEQRLLDVSKFTTATAGSTKAFHAASNYLHNRVVWP
jgi:hypothetical protein